MTPDSIVPETQLDERLQRLETPRLRYPTDLRDAGTSGSVVVASIIHPDGTVAAAEAMSTTHAAFAVAALEVARGSLFSRPAVRGRRVWAFVCIPIDFRVVR